LSQVEGPSCKLPELWKAAKKAVYPTLKDSDRLEILKALSAPNDAVQSVRLGPSVDIYTYKVDSGEVGVSYSNKFKSYVVSVASTVNNTDSQLIIKFNIDGKPLLQIEFPEPGVMKQQTLPDGRILSKLDELLKQLENKIKNRNLA
jgi:hypothetical protein